MSIHAHKTHTIITQLTPHVLREESSASLNLWPPSQFHVQTTFNSNFTLRFLTSFLPHTLLMRFLIFHVVLPKSETCLKEIIRFFKKWYIKWLFQNRIWEVRIQDSLMGSYFILLQLMTVISKKNPLLDSFIHFGNWPKNLQKCFEVHALFHTKCPHRNTRIAAIHLRPHL